MKFKITLLSALTALSLVLPKISLAANFSVRLGQPKTPTNQNNFRLTFVALDTQTDRNITVKCFKKGPSDVGYSQFDTDKVLIPGGNTDYCDVNTSILTASGSYAFYVTAEASSTILTSSIVTVDFNTSGPDTPISYSKERLNSCDYKIKFKTANDGKTVKVQLFRSDTLNISVNDNAVLSTQSVGPNTEGEFVNSVPACGKDYYYVIRAVDSSDNTSSTTGDSFTTTTTSTSTSSSSNGGANGSGAIVVNGGKSQVGNPDGENLSVKENASESATPSPSVLGTSTDKRNNLYKWLATAILIVAGFFFLRSRKTKSK